ncbi:glycosyltransferase family 2 protein [Jannaschia sp. R86511]|uniref:glycosyltransferase family 2 protein n=1 Tax=Jannaschia sp. R86511 TaxID=3093853 RepID=UPI0036D334BF
MSAAGPTAAVVPTSRTGGPTLAAVVPTYNYEAYLGAALDSLLAQDPPLQRVVVVDDGSSDGSVAVARSYGERVEVVEQTNAGQLAACLTGLDRVDTDYVWFLDADDLAVPGATAQLAGALVGRPVKVQFPLQAVDAAGTPTGSVFPTTRAGYDERAMARDNAVLGFYTCPPTSGNVYRRDVLLGLDRAALDPRDFIDGPATLVLPHLGGTIVCLERPLARYRVHGANHSQWFRPTPERLQGEVDWFERRWQQVCALLDRDRPPFGDRRPAYVLERRLMVAALQGRWWLLPDAVALVARLARSGLPRGQVLALAVWAGLLLLPVPAWRTVLVESRRDPSRRPAALRAAVSALRRLRAAGPGVLRPGGRRA